VDLSQIAQIVDREGYRELVLPVICMVILNYNMKTFLNIAEGSKLKRNLLVTGNFAARWKQLASDTN
jgi:hypothetical protein